MKNLNRFLFLLAFLKFILPFFLQHPVYEPHRDEFLYLAEGNHLAWGFMEVPPLISVFAWCTQHLGNNMFWIKCWPSLTGALTLLLVGCLILSEGGRYFSLFLLFCCFFFTGFLRVHFLFQPNPFEIFFYTLIAYGFIRYFKTSENKWLYLAGLAMGLGLLSKYSVAFYIVSLIPALLLTPQRTVFLNRHFYFAVGLALVIFLPNGIWQWTHHFPVVYHMQELNKTQLQYLSAASFIKDQFLMLLPCCFIWVAGFFYLLLDQKSRKYIFLCWAYLGVIILLLFFHGKSYYALGLYPILFGFGSLAMEKWAVHRWYFLRYVITIFILATGTYFIFIGLPVLEPAKLVAFYQKTHAAQKGILRWEDQEDHPLPQDFADMLGWEEMAKKTAAAYFSMDSLQRAQTLIFCDNYGMAGAINYYRTKYHLPEAYSTNASFLYWIPERLSFQNLIVISDDPEEMQHPFIKHFDSARLVGTVTNPYARENGTQIIQLMGATDLFRKELQDILEDARNKTSPH